MAVPTRAQMLEFGRGYVELWNAGKKEAWVANWKKIAPGGFKMLDPVGTPPKFDFEGCCVKPFDLFQPMTHFYVDPSTTFICGNELAWVMANTFTRDGKSVVMKSIEVYRFGEDGSVEIRTHYDVPDASDPVAGKLFEDYLPGHD